MKKFLALIISLSMILMCVPGISLVASAMEGEGTPENPYVIAEASDFLAVFATGGSLSTYENAYFVQTADIDLGAYTPDNTVDFAGTYDAQGNTINYTISASADANGTGAFGRVVGGTIKNLTVTGTLAGTHNFLGGVAGYCDGATFINCTNEVVITANTNNLGGIAGGSANPKAASTFINCKNNADHSFNYGTTAGILGKGFGTFTGCVNNGDIIGAASGERAGILAIATADASVAATAYVTITGCINNGIVKSNGAYSNNAIGGIVGMVSSLNRVTISECYNTGEIKGNGGGTTTLSAIGPMIGRIENKMVGENPSVTVTNGYSTGAVQDRTIYVNSGSAIGEQLSTNAAVTLSAYYDTYGWAYKWDMFGYDVAAATTTIDNAYFVNTRNTDVNDSNFKQPNPISMAEMQAGLPEGFSSDVWVSISGKYPMLKRFVTDGSGTGLEADPIIVASGETFAEYFGKDATAEKIKLIDGTDDYKSGDDNRYFLQICDITLPEGYAPHTTMAKWLFYNGGGYTINVDIKAADVTADNVGVIGYAKWSRIENVVIDGSIDAGTYGYVGGMVGRSDGGRLINITNKANVKTEGNMVGGVAGNFSSITNESINLVNYGKIEGADSTGGIIGEAIMTSVPTGYANYGNVSGITGTAGIFGKLTTSAALNFNKFVNIGSVTGSTSVAGIFGVLYNTGNIVVSESYNAGRIEGNDFYSAAIIAYPTASGNITVTDCFNTGVITTVEGKKGSALTASDKASGTITITNYYDAANKDIEVVELTSKSTGAEKDLTVTLTDAYILNASIKLDAKGAGESILPADLKAKDFGANWVAPTGVLAYPQLANLPYEGKAVAEVAPAAIATGTLPFVGTAIEFEGETYENAALFAGKFTGATPEEYGFAYDNGSNIVYVPANGNSDGAFGLILYNIEAGIELIVKPYIRYDGKVYHGAAQSIVSPAAAE